MADRPGRDLMSAVSAALSDSEGRTLREVHTALSGLARRQPLPVACASSVLKAADVRSCAYRCGHSGGFERCPDHRSCVPPDQGRRCRRRPAQKWSWHTLRKRDVDCRASAEIRRTRAAFDRTNAGQPKTQCYFSAAKPMFFPVACATLRILVPAFVWND